jgi:hypothetical protein
MDMQNIGFKNLDSLMNYIIETYHVKQNDLNNNKFIILQNILGYVTVGFYKDLIRIDYFSFDNGLLLQTTKLTEEDFTKGWIIITIDYTLGNDTGNLSVITYVDPPNLFETVSLLVDKNQCIIPKILPTNVIIPDKNILKSKRRSYSLLDLFPYTLDQINNYEHPFYKYAHINIYKQDDNNNINTMHLDFTKYTDNTIKQNLAKEYQIFSHDLIHVVYSTSQFSWFLIE